MNANFNSINTSQIQGGSTILDRLINSISDMFDRLGPIVTNNKIVPVTFPVANADVAVAHGLGFAVTSFESVDIDAAAIVYRSPTANVIPGRQIILRASAICHAKVRFE